MSMVDLILP